MGKVCFYAFHLHWLTSSLAGHSFLFKQTNLCLAFQSVTWCAERRGAGRHEQVGGESGSVDRSSVRSEAFYLVLRAAVHKAAATIAN